MALIGPEELTEQIIGGAIEVHRALGPGLLESAYRCCLMQELKLRGYAVQVEVDVPISTPSSKTGSVVSNANLSPSPSSPWLRASVVKILFLQGINAI